MGGMRQGREVELPLPERKSPFDMMRIALAATLLLVTVAGCRQRNDGNGTVRCMPGEMVEIGCAAGCGIGMCMGDATLRFCDGTLDPRACQTTSDSTQFVQIDDTSCGGLCPFGRVTCPASGSITVVPGSIGSGADCVWAASPLGILPPGGRGAEIVSCTPGAAVRIGCSDECGIGHCASGTARLRLCDGGAVTTSECQAGPLGHEVLDVTDASVLGSDCDFHCPEAVVTCPASGMIAVSPSAFGGASDFWCQWESVEPPTRADDVASCTPGTRVAVGCAAGCNVGSCVGNGGLRVCDGGLTAEQCRSASSTLGESFGSATCDSSCPETVVTCPASGAITVVSAASFSSGPSFGEGFACDWSVRPAGIGE